MAGQRWEESEKGKEEKKKVREEKESKKKLQVRENVKISQKNVFFHCFVNPEGGIVGALMRGYGVKMHARSRFRK